MRRRSHWLFGLLYLAIFVGVLIYQRNKYTLWERFMGEDKVLPVGILFACYIIFLVSLRLSASFRRFTYKPSVDDQDIIKSLTAPLALTIFFFVFWVGAQALFKVFVSGS